MLGSACWLHMWRSFCASCSQQQHYRGGVLLLPEVTCAFENKTKTIKSPNQPLKAWVSYAVLQGKFVFIVT